MDANYEESNRRQSSRRHNLMLKVSTALFAWAAKVFRGASNSCAQWAGAFIFAVALGAMSSVLAETDGFYTYSIDNQKAIITKYQGPGGDVVIPSSINGYPVTCIGKKAFSNCSGIISIVIPGSVTIIGDEAFSGCTGLSSVVIPDSVTSIGNETFYCCFSLSSVVIPDSVKSIGISPFSGCSKLVEIVVESANPSYISCGGILFDKNQQTLVQYPAGKSGGYQIPDTVTSIEDSAFSDCRRLTGIVIPDSVTRIGNSAFSECENLVSVVIPVSVNSIGSSPFSDCPMLVEIIVEPANPTYSSIAGVLFDKNQQTLIQYPAGKSGGYQVPDGVSSIGENAFDGCASLTNVVLPDSVISIGKWAFDGCTGLASIVIPDSVTSIGAGAFAGCSYLASIVIPDSVTSIGAGAFFWCSRLANIVIPGSVTSIGDLTFSKCENFTSVVIPGGVTSIGAVAFYKCSRLSSIVIPDSMTSIGNGAFFGCTRLTSVVIPASVNSIGVSPFADCSILAEIVVESANPSYSSCGGILFDKNQTTLIQYPAGKSGGYQISDSVTSIGARAFSGCSNLTGIVIPASVTSIGDAAFAECENLVGVYFAGTPPSSDDPDIFRNCPCIIYYASGAAGWGEQYGGRPTAVWNQQEHPQ